MNKLPWFRLYSRMIDDPKLKLLAFEDRWHFVAILCLKSDGLIDEPDSELRTRKIAVALGVQVRELDEIARRLGEVGLVDDSLNPLAWDELQFKSDNSTARVQAYRKRQKKQSCNKVKRECNVSETAQDTEQNRTEKKKRASAPVKCPDEVDEQVWSDWKRVRKKPVTPTALDGVRREAQRAGWPLNDALREAAERGWTGFKADWVEKREAPQAERKPMSNAEWIAKCEEKIKWARANGLVMVAREWEAKLSDARSRNGIKIPNLKVVNE